MLKLVHLCIFKIIELKTGLVDQFQCQDSGQRPHLLNFSSSCLNDFSLPRAMEKDHSLKSAESKGASISHSSGGKIP